MLRCTRRLMKISTSVQSESHYCHPRGTRRWVHNVSDKELDEYRDSLKRFDSRAYVFQNIALCKLRGKDQPTILTNKWPNFSCTAILQRQTNTPTRNKRYCRLQLLSDSEEEFGDFLHESKVLQEGAMIIAIDSVTNKHLDNVAKTIFPSWQKALPNHPLKIYYLDQVKDFPTKLDSKYFVDNLTPDHSDFIANYWTGISSDVTVLRKYFKHLVNVYTCTGVFKKSDPSYPVAWGVYGDFGIAIHLYTMPEYRREGLSFVVSRNLFAQLLEQGIIPVTRRHEDGSPVDEMFRRVMKLAADSIDRDSITGKRYNY